MTKQIILNILPRQQHYIPDSYSILNAKLALQSMHCKHALQTCIVYLHSAVQSHAVGSVEARLVGPVAGQRYRQCWDRPALKRIWHSGKEMDWLFGPMGQFVISNWF